MLIEQIKTVWPTNNPDGGEYSFFIPKIIIFDLFEIAKQIRLFE